MAYKMTHLHPLCFTAAVQERPQSPHEEFLAQMTKITVLYLVFKNFDSLCLFFFPKAPVFASSYPSLDFTFCSSARFPSLSSKENHATVGRYKICVSVSPICLHTGDISVVIHCNCRVFSSAFTGATHTLRFSGPLVQGYI